MCIRLRNFFIKYDEQVYPGGWSAVYAYLDNPGMWNLRSQKLKNWYLGQELYVRVYDADPNPTKERPPPQNLLFCGKFYCLACVRNLIMKLNLVHLYATHFGFN